MNSSSQYSALTRLLVLNNEVHDMENRMRGVALHQGGARAGSTVMTSDNRRIADMQEEIDRGVRASLATCWLGLGEDLDI